QDANASTNRNSQDTNITFGSPLRSCAMVVNIVSIINSFNTERDVWVSSVRESRGLGNLYKRKALVFYLVNIFYFWKHLFYNLFYRNKSLKNIFLNCMYLCFLLYTPDPPAEYKVEDLGGALMIKKKKHMTRKLKKQLPRNIVHRNKSPLEALTYRHARTVTN
ncbi:hypothetical protein BGU77_19170, partial [Clostridioides difficile]